MSSETVGRVRVQIDAEPSAVTHALLALEMYATRYFSGRFKDTEEQRAYNALGDIVLSLRAARDDALANQDPESGERGGV